MEILHKSLTSTTVTTYKVNDSINMIETVEVEDGKTQTSRRLSASEKMPQDMYGTPILVKSKEFRKFLETKDPFQQSVPTDCYAVVTKKSLNDPNNEIMWFYYSGDILFDSKLKPVPLIMHLEYIGSVVSNRYVEDEKLEEFRQTFIGRPDVISVSEIQPVPYYNRDENCNRYFDLVIRPSAEDTAKAFAMVDTKNKYWSCRMRELLKGTKPHKFDILGVLPFLKRQSDCD